ncbi:MAG: glycosyltransferase [Candidatus Omnitrophica bacterium]|nr:glycosyltransferase [Candidatus Omnitrophota bacterium]
MVSIIAPVFNDQNKIGLLIDSLLNQDYPKDLYEVILVDNGSTDQSKDVIAKYPVILLQEDKVQSSYAARNIGIGQANGDILAFIDSDCIADKQWLKQGVATLQSQGADMAGGKVEFFFSPQKTAAEIYDSMMSMQNQVSIQEMGASTTANLFVKAKLFKDFGLFAPVKSGGDIQWTSDASKKGARIVFAADAIVRHPTRDLRELLKKSLRVGKGYPQVWDKLNKSFVQRLEILVRKLLPQKPSSILRLINTRAPGQGYEKKLWKIWAVAYLCNITSVWGTLLFKLNR